MYLVFLFVLPSWDFWGKHFYCNCGELPEVHNGLRGRLCHRLDLRWSLSETCSAIFPGTAFPSLTIRLKKTQNCWKLIGRKSRLIVLLRLKATNIFTYFSEWVKAVKHEAKLEIIELQPRGKRTLLGGCDVTKPASSNWECVKST